MMADDRMKTRNYASSPCLSHEFAKGFHDPLTADPQQALDVARFREGERKRLLKQRALTEVSFRQNAGRIIAKNLDNYLVQRFGSISGMTFSAWWPIKAELNLRHWLERLQAQGARAALPVVVQPNAPLIFRAWTPETRMERGIGNIPVPAEGEEVVPDITLSHMVGWDNAGYCLGYGGAYLDRTLAALSPSPFPIGIGLDATQIATIFPQPHDIPMAAIITETGLKERYL